MTTTSQLIRGDLQRWREIDGNWEYFLHAGTLAVLLYRLAQGLRRHGPLGRLLSRALCFGNIVITGADLHAGAELGPGLYLHHTLGTVVSDHVRAGARLTLHAGVILGQGGEGGFPVIGESVSFGPRASAFGDVRVGDRVRVDAHSLVMEDIPADHTAVGIPARPRPRVPAGERA